MTNLTWLDNVRITKAHILREYIKNRFPNVGAAFDSAYVAYHSWRPGTVALSDADGEVLWTAIHDRATDSADAVMDSLEPVLPALRQAGFTTPGDLQIDELVGKMGSFPAIQNPFEAKCFLAELASRKPKVVVEIGTAAGGMLFCLCQVAADDALIVSIDTGEGGRFGTGPTEAETHLFRTFRKRHQRIEFIHGSSLSFAVRQQLEQLLAGRPVDVLFIDGDHNYGAVKGDFELYGPLVGPGGIIAFHDIATLPDTHGPGLEVGIFWRELRSTHPNTQEIIEPSGARSRGQLELSHSRHALSVELLKSGVDLWVLQYLALGSDFIDPASVSGVYTRVPRWDQAPRELMMAWGIGLVHA